MIDKSNLQLYFKELIKPGLSPHGIDKIRKAPKEVCDLLVYEPKNIEETQLGTLFMLGMIKNIPKNKYKNFDFLLNLLISVIKREFYSDYQRSTPEALESSLNKANLYLSDFTDKGNGEWVGNFDFICGAFSENTLHLAQVGNPIIKLFRENTVSHIENKFPSQKKNRPLKTFDNIASGSMLDGDTVVLGIKNILDNISLTDLKRISRRNCQQIVENLKNIIESKADKSPTICLVLKTRIRALQKVEIREPSIIKIEKKPLVRKPKYAKLKPIVLKTFYFVRQIAKKISKIVFWIIRKIICKIKPLKPHAFDKLKIRGEAVQKRVKISYETLYQYNKPVLIVAVLLIILILVLPFVAFQKINYHIKLSSFNKLSAEIAQLQKKTDTALIYQDKEKAIALMTENKALLAELMTYVKKSQLKNKAEVQDEFVALQDKYQQQKDSVSNVIRVKELEEILDFTATGFIVNPIGMSKIKNSLYFYEFESGILYKFDLTNEQDRDLTLIFISAKDELRNMSSLSDNKLALFGQSGKIYIYNTDINEYSMHLSIHLIEPSIPIENIIDVKSFLSNLYILDSSQNKIIKYSPGSQETIKGNDWLSDLEIKEGEAKSMAIDGAIYILNSDGLIIKYYKGQKIAETKPQLEKPLGEQSKIFTNYNFQNIYISDPQNNRLIVLNKEGKVVNQYLNSEFSKLQDFWVDNNEKEVYLICGKKVYKITVD